MKKNEYLHSDFDDPSQFKGNEEQKLAAFRQVRDVIKGWIEKTFGGEDKMPMISRIFSRTKK